METKDELKKNEIQKIDEEVLNELESTEVSGGKQIEDLVADEKNYVQCGCNNNKCGKAVDLEER